MSNVNGYIPQRIGHEQRDQAVQRLRTNFDDGRLDQATFEERTAAALAATTEDDLTPLFADLPPVAAATSFELYPHQTVATTRNPYLSDPVPYQGAPQGPTYDTKRRSMPSLMIGLLIVACFMFGLTTAAFLTHFPFWLFFIIPAIVVRRNRVRNRH